MGEELTLTGALFLRHRRAFLAGGVPLLFFSAFLCRGDGRIWEGVVLTSFLWAAAVFDYYYGLILDRLTLSMAALAVCFHLHGFSDMPSLLLGAFAGGMPLFVLSVLTRGGLGGGDVKLAAAGGLWLGWQGALLSLALASWLGGLLAMILLLSGRRRGRDAMAFGPFLSAGIFLSFCFGERILALYGAVCFG